MNVFGPHPVVSPSIKCEKFSYNRTDPTEAERGGRFLFTGGMLTFDRAVEAGIDKFTASRDAGAAVVVDVANEWLFGAAAG